MNVLIIGGSSDLGKQLALAYAQSGAAIHLTVRNEKQLEALVSDLSIRTGAAVQGSLLNLEDLAACQRFVQQLSPLPDVAICVAGYLGENEKSMSELDETNRVVFANYAGPVALLNALALPMAKRRSGVLVGISSVAGERGRQSNFIYGSAKAAFSTYLDGLRNWLFQYGVHVVTVKPGFMATSMTANMKLPPLLTASPQQAALVIKKGIAKRRNTIYVKWMWRYIMLIIRWVPEPIFKKMKM
ncbi:MAG: SDR family oxidoreductase [Chitinophagaceae bacterium]|nr:SDR family oxidoreductase [Chitinophagaceae bacterium]